MTTVQKIHLKSQKKNCEIIIKIRDFETFLRNRISQMFGKKIDFCIARNLNVGLKSRI